MVHPRCVHTCILPCFVTCEYNHHLTSSPALHYHYTTNPAPLCHHKIHISSSVYLQSTTPALYYLRCPPLPKSLSLCHLDFTSTPPINIPPPHSLHFITKPSLYRHKFTSTPPSNHQHPSSPIYHYITTITSSPPLHNQKMPPFIMRHDLIYVLLRSIVMISHVLLGYGVVVTFQVWKHQTTKRGTGSFLIVNVFLPTNRLRFFFFIYCQQDCSVFHILLC